jgi:hypothetical protein
MKKLLLITALATIISLSLKSQVYLGLGAGMSTKAPITELQVGIESKQIQFQTGFLLHLSKKVTDGVSLYGKISPVIRLGDCKLMPGVGYSYNLKSTDQKQLNGSSVLVSIYGYKEFGQGEIFAGINYTDKTGFLTIGLRMLFE